MMIKMVEKAVLAVSPDTNRPRDLEQDPSNLIAQTGRKRNQSEDPDETGVENQ